MRTRSVWLLAALLSTAAFTACDDGDPTDDTDVGTETETEAYDGEGVDWADKTGPQRQAFMQAVVLPTMKEKFEGHASETWTNMQCTTCHGEDPASRNFEMPSVFPLDPNNFPQPGAKPTVDFMYEEVVPTMIDLLKAEPFDPNTGEGFGCYSCHMMPS